MSFEWPGDESTPLPHEHREHIVVGPPGCGKTTWLTRQVQNAVKTYGDDGVIVGSLTRAAAAEVAGRDTGIPQHNIGTLHAHAYRALDRPGLAETPEGIKEWNEHVPNASWKLAGTRIDPEDAATIEQVTFDTIGDELLQRISVYRAQERDKRLWPADVLAFHHRWEKWKTESMRADFTDLIERAITEFPQHPSNPGVLMLDEAQDMSTLEMRLARQWGQAAEQLVIVGDPDQCLYAWRGAAPHVVFGDDTANIITLSQSYRVPAAVHTAAVQMIERVTDRLPIEYAPRLNGDGPAPGAMQHHPLDVRDPERVVGYITAELDEHPDRTVMVLASCGYMLRPLVSALKERGIPFHNPYRSERNDWNPLAGANRLKAFLRPDGKVWPGENRMWTWDELRRFTDPMGAKGNLVRGAKTAIEAKCLSDQFGQTRADEVVPIDRVLNLFEPAHHDRIFAMDVDWWQSTLRASEAKRQHFAVTAYKRLGPKALTTRPRVILGTIHSVKGGEADTVLLFPDLSPTGYWEGLKRPGEPRHSVYRLFYVGMTRAREKLIVGQPTSVEHIEW